MTDVTDTTSSYAGTYDVEVSVVVRVTIADDLAVRQVLENHDDEGQPQPLGNGARGWRDTFYDLRNVEDVLQMFAWNALANRATELGDLDGWANLDNKAATFRVDGETFELDFVRKVADA